MTMEPDASGVKGQDASFDTVEARTDHNVGVAARVMAAGVPVVPLREQTPLALAFPRLDTTIPATQRADIVAAWQAKKPGRTHQPFHVGSTVDGDRLNAWHAGRRDWTLGFGCSPGLVEAVVVDCDDEGGAALLAYLEAHGEKINFGTTPITVSGGRKGWHVWFSNPGAVWGCADLKAEIAADVKGKGGQVLLPGMVLSPKSYGGTMSGPRHYRALAGTPDLLAVLKAGTLPPLPNCIAALLQDRRGADSLNDMDPDVRAVMQELQAEPSAASLARDADAMVTDLRARDAGFDRLWRDGHPEADGSKARFAVGRALVAEFGTDGFDVHDLRDVLSGWDHAVGANDYGDREVARCYVRAAREFGARPDSSVMGAVDDESEAGTPQVAASDPLHALLDREVFGTVAEADAAQAVLVAAVSEDGLSAKGKARLDAQLDTIRGTGTAPRLSSYADFVRWVREGDSKPAPAPKGLRFETRRDIRTRSRAPTRFLVQGLLEAAVLFTLHGDYETGKSLVITDMLHCIAYGLPWAGRKTERAGVIYVCPEGPQGVARRQDAWHLRQAAQGNPVEDGPIEIVRAHVDLFTNDAHLVELEERVRTFEERHGIPCGVVTIDTMRQALVGGDENLAKDIGVFTAKLNRLRDRFGVSCGFVHHDGKDPARGASGSTAIVANVDVSLVAKTKTKGGKIGTLSVEKMRDGEDRADIGFTIMGHDAGMNTEGVMERAGVVVMALPKATPAKASDGAAMGAVEDPDDEAPAGEIAGCVQVPEHAAEIVALVAAQAKGKPETWVKAGPVLREFNHARNHPKRRGEQLSARTMSDRLSDLATAGLLRRDGERGGVRYALPEATLNG